MFSENPRFLKANQCEVTTQFNSLPKGKTVTLIKLKALADDKLRDLPTQIAKLCNFVKLLFQPCICKFCANEHSENAPWNLFQ